MKKVLIIALCALTFPATILAYEGQVITQAKTTVETHTVRIGNKTTVFTDTDVMSFTYTDTDGTQPPPPPADNTPVASFSYSPASPVEGQAVTLDGRSSTCQDAPCTYSWADDGPDGPGGTQWTIGTGAQTSFTWQNCPCTVWLRLTVTDADGDSNSVMRQFTVADSATPPPAAQCADGADNDGDGLVDLADPGCSSSSDNDETNVTQPPPTGDLYLSPAGSDSNACTSASPCLSFARAYAVAQSGQRVVVSTGTYGQQRFAGGAGSSQASGTKAVTFVGQSGAKVRQLMFGSPNLTFDGVEVDANGQVQGGESAILENSGNSFTFKNAAIGNTYDQKASLIDGPDITYDNVRFHDVVLRTSGVHTECIQALYVPRLTIRNSTFTNCAIMGLSLGYPNYWSPPPPAYDGVKLEGNTFNAPVPSNNYALAIWSNRYTGSCADGCDWGAMHNYSIKNNYVYSLINRQYEDATTVTCGNTGPGAPANWTEPCS